MRHYRPLQSIQTLHSMIKGWRSFCKTLILSQALEQVADTFSASLNTAESERQGNQVDAEDSEFEPDEM